MENLKKLNKTELEAIEKVRKMLEAIPQISCTNCKYCVKDCPADIPINKILSILNSYDKYNNLNGAIGRYRNAVKDKGSALQCINCKSCESVCPQHIEITTHLKRAEKLFE